LTGPSRCAKALSRSWTYLRVLSMFFELANILLFALLAFFTVFILLVIMKLVRPDAPSEMKNTTYECAEPPVGAAWFNFNPRFYIVALVFLIFDVEVAFTYPVAVTFRRWVEDGAGGTAFIELLVFVGILLVGLAYVWAKGDLEWIRKLRRR
jgi:NADH-quinone oxidoreductase subunit A